MSLSVCFGYNSIAVGAIAGNWAALLSVVALPGLFAFL
jgi:hypothetical protein